MIDFSRRVRGWGARAAFEGVEVTNVLLFTPGRAGSSAIMDELMSLEIAFGIMEPFAVEKHEVWAMRHDRRMDDPLSFGRWIESSVESSDPRNAYARYFDYLAARRSHLKPGATVLVWKASAFQVASWVGLFPWVSAHVDRIIYLTRLDVLKQALSTEVALARSEGRNDATTPMNRVGEVESFEPVYVDPVKVERRMGSLRSRTRNDVAALRATSIPLKEVFYESWLQDRNAFYRDLLEFMDIPGDEIPRQTRQAVLVDHARDITNWDEVRRIRI